MLKLFVRFNGSCLDSTVCFTLERIRYTLQRKAYVTEHPVIWGRIRNYESVPRSRGVHMEKSFTFACVSSDFVALKERRAYVTMKCDVFS